MTVADLKKVLNELPPQFDSFKVEIVARVERLAQGHWAREDHPVFGSLVDEHSSEFLLAHQEQFEQLKAYAQQGQNPGSDPGQHFSTRHPGSGQQDCP